MFFAIEHFDIVDESKTSVVETNFLRFRLDVMAESQEVYIVNLNCELDGMQERINFFSDWVKPGLTSTSLFLLSSCFEESSDSITRGFVL